MHDIVNYTNGTSSNFSKHFKRCDRIVSWLYTDDDGSQPNANDVANAMAYTPQSLPPF